MCNFCGIKDHGLKNRKKVVVARRQKNCWFGVGSVEINSIPINIENQISFFL